MEVFQNMWFTPVKEKPSIDKDVMIRKVMNITDVVAASEDMGLEWFEQLLVSVSITYVHNSHLTYYYRLQVNLCQLNQSFGC